MWNTATAFFEARYIDYSKDCYRWNQFFVHFSAYSKQLKQYRDHCDVILNEITEALRYLQDLQKQHLFVSTKTGALHEACEQLLQDQVGCLTTMATRHFSSKETMKVEKREHAWKFTTARKLR